jgi:transposase
LRNQQSFSLAELNRAIAALLLDLNRRPFKKLPGSREAAFRSIDLPAMRPLPAQSYVFGEWIKARVNIDYHLEVARYYYSVPYALVGKQLDVRLTQNTVEIFHREQRVASHLRLHATKRYNTQDEHMPERHSAHVQWTPERMIKWAHSIGVHTAKLIEHVLVSRPHPQQGFRSALGILRLGKHYGSARLEAACRRAVLLHTYSYRSIESILKQRLDELPLPAHSPAQPTIVHENLRGPEYFK